MDLRKAEEVRSILCKLYTLDEEMTGISTCKGIVLSRNEDEKNIDVKIGGYEVRSFIESVIKFLEDLEKRVHIKRVEVLNELTKL